MACFFLWFLAHLFYKTEEVLSPPARCRRCRRQRRLRLVKFWGKLLRQSQKIMSYFFAFLCVFSVFLLRKIWHGKSKFSDKIMFSYQVLIRITSNSLHGYIVPYPSICLWLQVVIFYYFSAIFLVFLLRKMLTGNMIIFHHNLYFFVLMIWIFHLRVCV